MSDHSLGKRLLCSIAAVAVFVAGHLVPLPGFSWSYFRDSSSKTEDLLALSHFSAGTLGFAPILSGFFLVELGALLFWRRLRNGSALGRKTLERAALVASVIVAASQSFLFATVTASSKMFPGFDAAPIVITLVGWTVLLLAVSRWLDGRGILAGLPTLYLADLLVDFAEAVVAQEPWEWTSVASWLATAAAAALVLLSRRWPLVGGSWSAKTGTPPVLPPLLAGILPFQVLTVGLAWSTMRSQFEVFGVGDAWLDGLDRLGEQPFWLLLPTAALTYFFGQGFYGREQLRRLREVLGLKPPEPTLESRRLRSAWAYSAAFYLGIGLVSLEAWRSGVTIHLRTPFLATALILDFAATLVFRKEVPDAVRVCSCHAVYWVPELLAALETKGIHAHAQSFRHRSLLHFFGPHVPIELLVPAADATLAKDILAPLLRDGLVHTRPTSDNVSSASSA
jgi:hypothetical protein